MPPRRHPEPPHYLPGVPLAFVDVETTGLSPSDGHRVCEIAVLRVDADGTERVLDTLVNPKRRISAGAFAVNRITVDMLRTAPQFPEIIPSFEEHLEGAVLVAHNAPFDLGFISAEYERAGRRAVFTRVIDTLTIARTLMPDIRHSLPSLRQSLRVRVVGAHRALADCRATRGVLDALVANHWATAPPPVDQLLDSAHQFQPVPVPFEDLPADLAEALRTTTRLFISYQSTDGNVSERWINVRSAVRSGQRQYLVAYCETRESERQFRIDRIREWRTEGSGIGQTSNAPQSHATPRTGTIEIRALRKEELEPMRDLWRAAGLPFKPLGRENLDRLTAELNAGQAAFLGAFADGRMAGVVIATDDGRRGWINRLAVHPDFRRRDIARALIRAAEAHLESRGIQVLCALIEEDNMASRGLFTSAGYAHWPEVLYFTKRPSNDA